MDADGGVAWQQSLQEEKSVLDRKVMLSIFWHCHFFSAVTVIFACTVVKSMQQ